MNDRNSIYLKKLNRCTRSRLTGSSSIVRIHSDFTVRDSYMTRWVEHGCAWVIHAKYEQQIYYAYAVDIYDVLFDLRLAEALMYIICWVYFVCKSPVRLLPKRREFETGDMKHWKWSRTQVWYHLVFFFFWPGLTIFPRNARWIQPPEYSDGYERAYDMLMKWKWIQPLRFLDSIMRWMWVLTTNFPMSILHSLDIVCGFDSI